MTGSSVVAYRVRFIFGLILVTAGPGAFAVAFRTSLTAVYQAFYDADNTSPRSPECHDATGIMRATVGPGPIYGQRTSRQALSSSSSSPR